MTTTTPEHPDDNDGATDLKALAEQLSGTEPDLEPDDEYE